MHTVSVARKPVLSALIALVLLAGALGIASSNASAARSQCDTSGRVCAWSTTSFEGTFSWWAASNTGCKTHEMNPNIRAIWNRAGTTVTIPERGVAIFGGASVTFETPVTGNICW